MTATIWKFPIPIEDESEITMPFGAELLHVDTQNDAGQLWARVVPERTLEARRFSLRGTGHPVEFDCRHVGTFIIRGGALVFHRGAS